MRFTVKRRSKLLGVQERWLEIDIIRRVLKYYDNDPNSTSSNSSTPHKYAWPFAFVLELEHDTLPAPSPFPSRRPNVAPPELRIMIKDHKSFSVTFVDHDTLASFVDVCLASNPLTTLLIAGKPQPRKVLTASARGNARASAITTSSTKAAPFPMARASAIVTGTTPNKGVGSLANGAGGFSLSRDANAQPGSLKRSSMVPKFVQERRDEEAKAQARDRLHARWNAAPVADATAAKVAAEKALEDKNKKPSGLALALAKQAASSNNTGNSSSSSSRYATLLAPFTKAIISKILSLKSSASGKPLFLRFLKLNQLLLLIVEAPDPHPSTPAQLEKGYALVRDFEELIREEYAMGSEKRAREREARLLDSSSSSKSKVPEEEADEQTLSRSLQSILQLLFDLLALRMGDIEFTPVIKEKLQQVQGDELSFLRDLRDTSAKLLREQAGAVFGVDRSKISHKSGSIISISSSVGGSSILRDAISTGTSDNGSSSGNKHSGNEGSEDMGLDDKSDSPLLQGSTPGTSQVSGVPLSESLLAGESLPSINLLDESHHPSLSLNTSGSGSGSATATRRRSSAHTGGAPPVSSKSRGNSLHNIPETMQITVDVTELNVIHEHEEDPLVAASLGASSRRATFDRARNSASSFHLNPQSLSAQHKTSVSASNDSFRSRLSSKRLSSRESISLNAVLELDMADEDEVAREKRRMEMLASLDEEGGSPKAVESDEDLDDDDEEAPPPPPPTSSSSTPSTAIAQPVTVAKATPAPTVDSTSSTVTETVTATMEDDFLDDEFAPPAGGRGRAVALIKDEEPKPVTASAAKPASTAAAAPVAKSAATSTKPQPTPQQQQQRRASLIARENALQQHRNKLAAKFTAKQNEVQRKWNEYFEKHPSLFTPPTYPNLTSHASPITPPPPVYTRDSPAGQQLKQLIRMYGIPQRVRGKVWKVLTNLEQLKSMENAAWKQRLQAKGDGHHHSKPVSSPANSPPAASSVLSNSFESAGGFPSVDELKQLLKREKNSDACHNSYYRGLLVRGLDVSRHPAALPPTEKKLSDALQAIERDFAKLHQNAARESGNTHLPPIVPNTNYSLPFLLPSYLTPVTSLMSLHRILIAYALRNPNMGYLQSINQLVSLILLVLEVKEEDANASINLNHMPKTNLDDSARKASPTMNRSSASDLVQSPLVAAAAMAEANSIASARQGADPSAASLQIPPHEEDAFFLLIVLTEEVCSIRMGEGQAPETERVPHTSPSHPLHASYLATCAARDELYPVLFYYNHDLLGLRIDQEVFAALAADKLPKVHNHLTNVLNIPLEPFFFSWFTNLLIQTLPLDLTLRIWDLLFSEGIKVLFRATLTILKMVEETILAVENEADLLVFLRGFIYSSSQLGGSSSHGSNDAHDGFIRTMFNSFGFIGSLSMSRVGFLRKWYRSRLENVTAAYAKGRKAQAGGALARLPSPVRNKIVEAVSNGTTTTAAVTTSAKSSTGKQEEQKIPAAGALTAGTTISDEDSEQFWNQLHELEQAKRVSRLQQKSALSNSIIATNSEAEKKTETASTTGRVRGATFLVAEPVSSVNETTEEKDNSVEPTTATPQVKVKKLSESSKSIAVALSAMLPVHPPTRRVSVVAGARVHGVAAALLNPRESLRDSILNVASGSLHHGIEEEEEDEDDEDEEEEEEQESVPSVAIHVDASVKDVFAKSQETAGTTEAAPTPSTSDPAVDEAKPKKKKQYTPEQQAARDAHKAGKAARKAARAEKRAKKAARAAARLALADQAATPLQRDLPATNHPPGSADSNFVRISVVDLPPANGSGTVQWPSRPIRGPDAALSDPAAVQSRISISGRASVSQTSAPGRSTTTTTTPGAPTVEDVADVTISLDVPADNNEVLNRFSRLSAVLDTIPADKSKINACHGCGKEIVESATERMISAMGFVFHSACFNCSCFGVDPSRSCKHSNLLGQAYLITGGKLYGEACYRVRFGKSCAICSKEIREGEISMSTAPANDDGNVKLEEEEEQLHFHQSCVACLNCHKKAHEAPLFKYEAEKYDPKASKPSKSTPQFACETCFTTLTAPKCYACTKPILPTNSDSDNMSGDGVLVQGKQFHSDCVTCAVCKIAFNKIEPTPQVLLSSLQPVDGLSPNAEPPMVLYCGSHTRGLERQNCCFSCIEPLILQSTVSIPITGHNPSETGMRSTTPKPTTARYHTSCAKCMVCSKTVLSSRECLESAVVARDLFCPAHKRMSPAVCNRCNYVIIEAPVTIPSSGLQAPTLTFHAACLICAHPPCAKNLKGVSASDIVFDVITGAPKCKAHFPSSASAASAAPVAPVPATSSAPSSPRTPAPMPVLSPRKAAALASSSPSPTNSPRATTPTAAILSSSPTAVSSIPPSNNILGRAGGFRPPKLNNAPALPSRAPPGKPKTTAPVPIRSPALSDRPSPVSPRSPAGPSSRAAAAAASSGALSPRSPVSPRSPISPRSPMSPNSPPPPPPPMQSPPLSPRSQTSPVIPVGAKLLCSVCQSSSPPASLLLGGQMYHSACLKCVSCSSIFKDGVGIYPKDGHFFCRKCFVKQFATCCAKCSKPIESGAVVKIPELSSNGQPNPNGKEQEFHSKCFSCSQCKTNLAGQPFLQHASKGVLCEKCAH